METNEPIIVARGLDLGLCTRRAVPLTGASTEVFYAARRKHSADAVLVGSGALPATDGETNPVAGHCYMTSLRQIESNRRNAQRSTGPKTQSGKQRSSQNAVRHGLTAETVIGPLEIQLTTGRSSRRSRPPMTRRPPSSANWCFGWQACYGD